MEGWDANTVTHVLGLRLRHATALRAGHRSRPAPAVVRAERRRSGPGPLQRRVRRRLRHPIRFHDQARRGPAATAARDDPGQGRASRPRRARNPLPPRRRISRRAAGRASYGGIQRRFNARAHSRPGRPVGHSNFRDHRGGRRHEPGAPGRHAPIHAALPRHSAPAVHEMARPWRRTASIGPNSSCWSTMATATTMSCT